MLRTLLTGGAMALALPALAQQADPAAGGGAATNAPAQVAAIVDSEFPVYDADSSGELEQAEFSKWLLALKQQEMQATGKTMAPDALTAWAAAAFQTADADRSAAVSKAELTRYLGG